MRSPEVVERPAATAALDLHEGIADPARLGCGRWPEALRLVNHTTGELVRGRCRATRKCHYCGRLGAVENAEMVALDAMENAPTAFVVLTTVDPFVTREQLRRDLEQSWRSVRRRFPDAEYACFVEFTTGLSVWSGGHRRIHLNLLTKGVDDLDAMRSLLLDTWGRRTKTSQLHVGPIYAAEGLVRYVTNLALHVMKDGQKPPPTYEGHLIRWTRGYFPTGATAQRETARKSLRLKRLLHRGLDAETAALELAAADATTWTMAHVQLARKLPNRPRPDDSPESVQNALRRMELRG